VTAAVPGGRCTAQPCAVGCGARLLRGVAFACDARAPAGAGWVGGVRQCAPARWSAPRRTDTTGERCVRVRVMEVVGRGVAAQRGRTRVLQIGRSGPVGGRWGADHTAIAGQPTAWLQLRVRVWMHDRTPAATARNASAERRCWLAWLRRSVGFRVAAARRPRRGRDGSTNRRRSNHSCFTGCAYRCSRRAAGLRVPTARAQHGSPAQHCGREGGCARHDCVNAAPCGRQGGTGRVRVAPQAALRRVGHAAARRIQAPPPLAPIPHCYGDSTCARAWVAAGRPSP
jgi:hypothetical protein